MKRNAFFFLIGCSLFIACNTSPKADDSSAPAQTEVKQAEETLDVDEIMVNVNAERLEIEEGLDGMEKRKMATSNLLPTISNKWADITFHSDDSGLRRVKTMPQPKFGDETREYYFTDGALRCVVIETEGAQQTSEQDLEGTVFYFSNGKLIREMETNTEQPWNEIVKEEVILQEAKYYLDLHQMVAEGKQP